MEPVVLDTDVASLIIKRRLPDDIARPLVGRTPIITFVTLAELTRWVEQRQWGPHRRERLAQWLAGKAYDQVELRRWLRKRGIAARIARKGVESSQRLGRHRWVIERSIAWLFGYHRLGIRYDRDANHFCAFVTLAATLVCFKKLTRATT